MLTPKRILFCFAALIFVLLAAGCVQENEDITPPAGPVKKYTLTYTAGENGSIKGSSPQRVDHGGTGSEVTAIPADGYHFENWDDGVNTPSRTDSAIKADLTVTAGFALNHYSLTYIAGGNGTIEGFNMQSVNHGDDGRQVKAVPAEHYHFMSWSDGVTTATRTDRSITADLEVTANFAIDQYTLAYSAGENGSIEGAKSQKIDHGGTGTPVKAVPAAGYHFLSWSDGVTTADRTDSDVKNDLKLAASFARNQYTLTYTAGENGTIEGAKSQEVDHGGDGSQVKAVPAKHYHFKDWSDGKATASRTDRNITADLEVTANFAINQYTLTYNAGENGTIKGSNLLKVDHEGTGSEITAVPAEGYHFVSWSDGVTDASRKDSGVESDLSVTAIFALNQYILTYTAGENGTIEGTNPQAVNHGSDGSQVTAVADNGYHFLNWSDGVTNPQRIDFNVTGDMTVSAFFEVNTYTVGGSVSGLVENTQVVLQNNGTDDLAITANGDFQFATELFNADIYAIRVLTQPTSPNQTCEVTNGNGTVPDENVIDIEVVCVLNTYTIGGTVSGLPEGDQVVLRYNNDNDLAIDNNGSFVFAEPLDDGSAYEVNIHTPPKRQNWNCELANGAGTLSGRDVTDVVVVCYPLAVLKSKAGFRKITLTWNIEDFNEIHDNIVVFNFCRAEEEIPPDSFRHCRDFKGGFVERKVTSSPFLLQELPINTHYWFQLQVLADSGNLRTYSEVVKAIPFGGLNDTGIDWCADNRTNYESDGTRAEKNRGCNTLIASYPNQDAFHGWDALARNRKLAKTGTGTAGFDFTKICRNGDAAGEEKCSPNPSPGEGENNWGCTHDNVTGLTWEVKMESGLGSKNNTYTWYNPDETVNGNEPGLENGGKCKGSNCDTLAYIEAVNEKSLCGASDWRLPTKRELLSIVDNGQFKPAIDTRFFPNTLNSHYWTSSPYPEQENSAWQVYFLYGEAEPNIKSESNHIRLVSGRAVTFGLDNP